MRCEGSALAVLRAAGSGSTILMWTTCLSSGVTRAPTTIPTLHAEAAEEAEENITEAVGEEWDMAPDQVMVADSQEEDEGLMMTGGREPGSMLTVLLSGSGRWTPGLPTV